MAGNPQYSIRSYSTRASSVAKCSGPAAWIQPSALQPTSCRRPSRRSSAPRLAGGDQTRDGREVLPVRLHCVRGGPTSLAIKQKAVEPIGDWIRFSLPHVGSRFVAEGKPAWCHDLPIRAAIRRSRRSLLMDCCCRQAALRVVRLSRRWCRSLCRRAGRSIPPARRWPR